GPDRSAQARTPMFRSRVRSVSARTALLLLLVVAGALVPTSPLAAQASAGEAPALEPGHLSMLTARDRGGAFMSGRISDLAVDPRDHRTW
ncbi:MAG TPA: hypothetical protein VK858_19270, partial [Longimicrobiales bacterium]|nr:hypothetical protein [Longimicrobiales bacterium]